MQTRYREIAGEIRAVSGQKHRCTLDIRLLDRRDFVSDRQRYEVRPIHLRVVRLGIHRIKCDFVFRRILAVQVTSYLDSRFETFFKASFVPQIFFVLRKRIGFNVSAEVLELLRPFVSELNGQENQPARDRGQHVPPIGTIPSHL